MLTLRRLTDDLGLRVLAGEEGLDAGVRWVHISELPDPTPWLSGGELLLTTGMRGLDADYVDRLAGHGLAGLGVGLGTDGGMEEVPPAALEAAQARGFPLFTVPVEMPFLAITERAAGHIVNESYATLQRAIAAHDRLQDVVLAEGGLEGIARELAAQLEAGVAILDARGERLAQGGDTPHELAKAYGVSPLAGTRTAVGDPPQAWLVVDKPELKEFDRLLLRQAVTVVALELLRGRVAADTERRLAGDVLASLLSGEITGIELRRRLAPFGLRDSVAAVVLAPPEELRDAVERELPAAVRAEAGAGLAATAGPLACALVGAHDEPYELAERLRARVSEAVGQPLPAGAGRAVAPADARRTFHEARCALEARQMAGNGVPGVATFQDLGSFQLLLSLQDDDALRLFCDSILSPLEEGEGAYGEELVRSLEVFIECNGQWEKAARQLFCHRHTLRYRIRRVEELTGRSLDSARDRIDFWLALRGREVLS
jgi:purine catabolism regulator